MIKKILATAALGVLAIGAHAASTNLQVDGDFESTGQALTPASTYCYPNYAGAQCSGAVSGWSGTGDVVFLNSDSAAWQDPSAQSHAGIDLGGVVAGVQRTGALISDFALTVGQEYVVSWVSTGRAIDTTAQSYLVSAGGVSDAQAITTAATGWTAYSFDFVATATTPLTFTGLSSGSDSTAFIDNVTLTAAVPEPGSALLMVIGTLGLLAWRRRAQV